MCYCCGWVKFLSINVSGIATEAELLHPINYIRSQAAFGFKENWAVVLRSWLGVGYNGHDSAGLTNYKINTTHTIISCESANSFSLYILIHFAETSPSNCVISSPEEGDIWNNNSSSCGTASHPWRIVAQPESFIILSLIDYDPQPNTGAFCRQYAVLQVRLSHRYNCHYHCNKH